MSEERVCEVCGKILTYHQKRFCSKKCNGIGITGENHHNYKPEIAERLCELCGQPRPRGNSGHTKFCSRRCMGKATTGENNPFFNPHIHDERTCEMCEGPLKPQQKRFCSGKCYGMGIRGEDNLRWRAELHEGFCKVCRGPLVERWQKRFCSHLCEYAWKSENWRGKNASNWQGGISFEPYGSEFNNYLKVMIRDRDNHECQYCGISESELYRKLDVHHLNYSKKDNRESNLLSLCQKCHLKTNYRRWYWEAYFKMKVQEKDSIQSRLHLITQEE